MGAASPWLVLSVVPLWFSFGLTDILIWYGGIGAAIQFQRMDQRLIGLRLRVAMQLLELT
jgi:hypothetical protein